MAVGPAEAGLGGVVHLVEEQVRCQIEPPPQRWLGSGEFDLDAVANHIGPTWPSARGRPSRNTGRIGAAWHGVRVLAQPPGPPLLIYPPTPRSHDARHNVLAITSGNTFYPPQIFQ